MLKLVTVLVFVSLSSGSPLSVSKREGFRLCGSMLVETLTMICGGQIYTPVQENGKRDVLEERAAESALGSYFGLQETERSDLAPSPTVRRQLGGIAEECCTNSCSFATLASYCAK